MKCTPKVRTYQRKKYKTYVMQICNNYRDPRHGKPRHRVLFAYRSLKNFELCNPAIQTEFHRDLEAELQRLITEENCMQRDAARIRDAFSKIVPLPAAALLPPASFMKPELKRDIHRLKAKYPILLMGSK